MKVKASVKVRCEKCKVVRRQGVVRIICPTEGISRGRGKEGE